MNQLDETFKFRLPAEQLAAFHAACADNDMTAAQVLRAAVRAYIAEHSKPQGDLLKPKKRGA
jgi:hypothetical protein